MAKTFLWVAVFLFSVKSWGALHVNMFSSPIVLIHEPAAPYSSTEHMFYISDSINTLNFVIATNADGVNLCFTTSDTYNTKVDNDSGNASIFRCAGTLTSDTNPWQQEATLAKEVGDANFDGKGVNYVAYRYNVTGGYNYGWFKISCSPAGDTLTIYGYGYNDQVSVVPNILMGEGDCITGISQLEMPTNFAKLVNGNIQISYPEPLEIKMYNVQGQFIRTIHFEGGETSYNCSSLARGMYFLETYLQGQRNSAKIVL